MTRSALKLFSVSFILLAGFAWSVNSAAATIPDGPGAGGQFTIDVDVSPYKINIESIRDGEIRIFTNLRYSLYLTSGEAILIYVNHSGPIQNVRPTRDSLGNLILKFDLSELKKLDLEPDAVNPVEVTVILAGGEEYVGRADAFIKTKGAP